MKIYYIYFLILTNLSTFGQENSSTRILYKAEYIGIMENQSQSAEQKEIQRLYKDNYPKIIMELLFNKSQNLFQVIKSPSEDGNMYYELALLKVSGNKTYYKDATTKEDFFKVDFQGDSFLIANHQENYNWGITSESKMIGEFKCFKANGTKKITANAFSPAKDIAIEAWFSPEIPNSLGPCGFFGLPGVILSVTSNNILIYASEIQTNQKFEIKKPEAKTHFENEAAFEAMMMKKFNDLRNNRG